MKIKIFFISLIMLLIMSSCSTTAKPAESLPLPDPFFGTWVSDEDPIIYRFEADGSWFSCYSKGPVKDYGSFSVKDNSIQLLSSDDDQLLEVFCSAENSLSISGNLYYMDTDYPVYPDTAEISGIWRYEHYDASLTLTSDHAWQYFSGKDLLMEGSYRFHGVLLVLTDQDNNDMLLFWNGTGLIDDSGDLLLKTP